MNPLQKIHKLIGGSSPWTGYIGTLGMILSALQIVHDTMATQEMPTNLNEWGAFLLSLGVRLSKDWNKSNSPVPVREPQTVPVERPPL